MKKTFLLLFLAILLISTPKFAFADQPSASPSASVKYDLAFPGLLPDSPLYKLKVLRDRIEEALINDPNKKIEFYLLQTDKGILASSILLEKHKIALAEDTAYKAENNYTKLTFELWQAGDRLNDKLYLKLRNAALKHQDVLNSMKNGVPEKDKAKFDQIINYSKTNLKTVEDFQNRVIEQ